MIEIAGKTDTTLRAYNFRFNERLIYPGLCTVCTTFSCFFLLLRLVSVNNSADCVNYLRGEWSYTARINVLILRNMSFEFSKLKCFGILPFFEAMMRCLASQTWSVVYNSLLLSWKKKKNGSVSCYSRNFSSKVTGSYMSHNAIW